jgi:DNA-binding CsgD family transcriptional regulator
VNKSLVVSEANGDGAVRFRMPDLIRRYGRERLEKSGVSDTVCRRHTEFCLEGPEVDEPELDGSAEDLRETLGVFLPFERHVHGRRSGAVSAQLDEAAWEVAWAERQTIAFEGTAEYALSQEQPTTTTEETSSASKPTPLTRREWEVAALVGRGLTNRQISVQLVLSVHTVAKHVRKILKKLGFQSRAQIAAWVGKRG